MKDITLKTPFLQLPASKKLTKLAEHPVNLADPNLLTPQRIRDYQAESGPFDFFFATEQVNDEVLKTLEELAHETGALSLMEKMQAGEVLNFIEGYPSENRSVLHTALRDFFDRPNPNKVAIEARTMTRNEVDKLEKFEKEMDPFTDLVLIGIGGSELGPKAIYMALKGFEKPGKKVHFIGNVDPDDAALVLSQIELNNTLFMVVSKTGTTLETNTNEELVRSKYKAAGIDSKNHFIAVTGEASPMDNTSIYRACFYIWDWVGGRFSASSTIGGVILTFAYGFKTYMEFLKGAHVMDLAALESSLKKNIPLLSALIGVWNRDFLHYQSVAIIPYSQMLHRFSAHVQQVEMESNGKRIDRQGEPVDFDTSPIFWGEPGTNAQHSFFQTLHQGTTVVPVEFIGFKESQTGKDMEIKGSTSHEKLLSNMIAQSLALATGQTNSNPNKVFPGNRPSHILFAEKLDPYTMGALFAYVEHKVAFQGFLWNINTFDQEGVQLGKVLANRFIDLFKSKRNQAVKTEFTPVELAYYDLLYPR